MIKGKSRAELSRRLEAAEADIRMLTALVFVVRKILIYSEHARNSASFTFTPTGSTSATSYVKLGVSIPAPQTYGTLRTRPASHFTIPPLKTIYEHLLCTSELNGADQ